MEQESDFLTLYKKYRDYCAEIDSVRKKITHDVENKHSPLLGGILEENVLDPLMEQWEFLFEKTLAQRVDNLGDFDLKLDLVSDWYAGDDPALRAAFARLKADLAHVTRASVRRRRS